MKKAFGLFLTLSLSWLVFASFPLPVAHSARPDDPARLKALESYGKLPLSFVENKGQVDKKVSFYLKGSQGTIYFTKEAIIYDLILGEPRPSKREGRRTTKEVKRLSFTLKPVGARKGVRLIANERLPGRVNYFIGSDPKGWRTDIPIYREILYEGFFTGIDLRLYGTNNQMEYDFIVQPGADPDAIRMAFNGIEGLNVDEAGNLVIRTPFGALKHLRPVIYQEVDGRRQMVEGSFKVAKKSFGFEVKAYDRDLPLIIDPVTLSYSTYLGGSADDYGYGIAVDSSGNAYVAGLTTSPDFPTEYPYQGTSGGSNDAFVTKLGPAGDILSYSTYLGGNGQEQGLAIAVDSSGNAYVTGDTDSTDFPTQNPYQGTSGGGWDAFVTKLGPAGDTLSYSTYLGGSNAEFCYAIAVDSSGNAYVAGVTISTNFPTVNPYQGTFRGGVCDAFVTKFGPAGDSLSYSTYLGGSLGDWDRGIAVDSSGNAYITGFTDSTDFPTHNPYQGTSGGGREAFVTKLGPAGDTLSYSTYLGGGGEDRGSGIAVDSSGNAYVTGYTISGDFPTVNPYQGTSEGGWDAFVTKFSPAGDSLSYSTYLGGSSSDIGYGIAVDVSGNAYVTGYTNSADFPTVNPYQGTLGVTDAFVTRLDPAGDTLSYSTYLGGSNGAMGYGIAVDVSGNAYVTGNTYSTDFPTVNAYQGTFGGGVVDAFVTKLVLPIILTSPNGGEVIPSGSLYPIQWVAPTAAVTFKLKYSLNNGKTWKLIEGGITDMSYDWTVPTPKKNKTKCLVKVIGYDVSGNQVGTDESDGMFTVEVLTLTSPNGGETLTSGNPHTITWTTNGTKKPVAKVILKCTTNGGRTWKKIHTELGDPGSYGWTVSDVTTTKDQCRMKLILKDARGRTVASDVSDVYFTIGPSP
jgi:hypothetical protein